MCSYYRKFVPSFASIAAPLHALLASAGGKWLWIPECQEAIDKLRTSSQPLPDYKKPFLLYTDASTTGIGDVLAQLDNDNREHPIVYLSRSLTPAKRNCVATELECLGMVWAIGRLRPYLDGSKLTVITDHSALQWIMDYKGNNSRLNRWSVDLQTYRDDITIRHRAGRMHSNVDPLSRMFPAAEILTILTRSARASKEIDIEIPSIADATAASSTASSSSPEPVEDSTGPYSTAHFSPNVRNSIIKGYKNDRFQRVIDSLV